jgi:predicted kinase
MLAGLPGTGKTTLAYAIARRLPFIVLDKDLIDSVLLNGALQQDRASPLAYEVLLRLADDLVAVQHRSVILDTAGRQPIVLDRASQIARKSCRSATRSNPALKELTLVVS